MLLRNSIAWFEVEEDVVIEANYAPGSVIQPLRRVRADKVHVAFLRDSQRVTRTLDVREGLFYFGETDQPGIYEVTVAGMPHPTTVNLFDPGESAISPNLDEAASKRLSAETGRHILNRDMWSILALLGLLFWCFEWFSYHRRITE